MHSASTAIALNFSNCCATAWSILLFANEAELKSLYETADFDNGARRTCARTPSSPWSPAAKRAASSSRATRSSRCRLRRSRNFVDTTGAGDLFAAGFLTGIARGRDHVTAGKLGALAAAEVIQHLGARPEISLKTLAGNMGLAV